MTVTWDQISGIIDRFVLVALTYAAGKGWISSGDVANFAAAILAILGAFWGWWVNRPKAVIQSAAAIPGTTVVTTPAIASATPEANIVSNTQTKVVAQ